VTVNWNPSLVNLGDVFTANTSGTVCALGIYAGNTNANPETVGLYTIGGTPAVLSGNQLRYSSTSREMIS
jgi:hypothetical protein